MKREKLHISAIRILLFCVVLQAQLLAGSSLPAWAQENKAGRVISPNIIFILLDAARADHFSGYGYKKNTTPRLDALARRGALFLKNFAPATDTYNSLPCILSSRYFSAPIFSLDVGEWGVRRETSPSVFKKFDDEQILLPELLSARGYRTAIFHNHHWFGRESYFVRKFDENHSFPVGEDAPHDGEITDAVISWIQKNRGEKFFIYCHIMSPHEPYHPKQEDIEILGEGNPAQLREVRNKIYRGDNISAEGWSRKELGYLSVLYDGNLKHSDRRIGLLYDQLQELGLAEQTLLIVTSDHGESLGEHGQLLHGGNPWESLIHVPLIMVYPPRIPAGIRVAGLTESIDIAPTICDLCGIELPPGKKLDGISLLPFMGTPSSGKEAVFTYDSIRTKDYKYMMMDELLFDLKKDPGEDENISEVSPRLRQQLIDRYEQAMLTYRQRYQAAKRDAPPDYPFFLVLDDFRVSPPIFNTCCDRNGFDSVLKEASATKPWLLNTHPHSGGLFCLPASGPPPPITLSTCLPDGIYRVSVLIETLRPLTSSPPSLGFKSRFGGRGSFAYPKEITPVRGDRKDRSFSYLDLGETAVEKETFSFSIEFHPPDSAPYFIRHLKFDPVGRADQKIPEPVEENELRRRREGLGSLGYL